LKYGTPQTVKNALELSDVVRRRRMIAAENLSETHESMR